MVQYACISISSLSQSSDLGRKKADLAWTFFLDCSSAGLEREQPELWDGLGFREPGLVSDQFPGGQAGQEQKSRKMRQINPKAENPRPDLEIFFSWTLHHSQSSQVHLKKCEFQWDLLCCHYPVKNGKSFFPAEDGIIANLFLQCNGLKGTSS